MRRRRHSVPSSPLGGHATVVLDWRYDSPSDILVDVPPDVITLRNRVNGEATPVQLTSAKMPHDSGDYILGGEMNFTRAADANFVDSWMFVSIIKLDKDTKPVIKLTTDRATKTINVLKYVKGNGEFVVALMGMIEDKEFCSTSTAKEVKYKLTDKKVKNLSGLTFSNCQLASLGLIVRGLTYDDIPEIRDEMYNWAVDKGLITNART